MQYEWFIKLHLVDEPPEGTAPLTMEEIAEAVTASFRAGVVLRVRSKIVTRRLPFIVSDHAIKRYMERSGTLSANRAKQRLNSMLHQAVAIELQERWRVIQLINHDYKDADYYKCGQWILVVVNGAVVTVHQGTAKRWRTIEKLEKEKRANGTLCQN